MMKRLKKILSLITAAALCVGLLAGCGSSGTLTETNRLNIYNIAGNDSRKLAFCYSVNSRFQANYPDVGLDYRTSEYQYYVFTFGSGITDKVKDELQQYYDSVSVNIMKGKGEDVIFADTFYQWFDDVTPPDWQKMVRAGAFADLIPLVSNYAPDIDLSVFDDLLIDGKLYAIPVAREPFYIFSAEKMLEKWGFDFDASDDILTFLRKCAQWQQEHETDPSAPIVFSKEAWEYLYYNIFDILGTDVVDYQSNTANFSQPEVLEVMELLKQLKSERSEPLVEDIGSDVKVNYNRILFGRSNGTYDCSVMRAIGYNYLDDAIVFVPLRQLDGKVATASNTYLMIPDNAANKLNAAKYVATCLDVVRSLQTDDETESFYTSGARYLSWDNGEEAFEARLDECPEQKYTSADFKDTIRDLYQNQGTLCMPSCWYYSLKSLFDDYMQGTISIDTLAQDVQSRLEIYVSE